MSDPYDIYGDVVEFTCPFGRLFIHVNVAPRQTHRHRLDAIEAVFRDTLEVPEDGEERTLELTYPVKIWHPRAKKDVMCDRIDVRFRRLHLLDEDAIDETFAYQKGGIREDDVFIERLLFLPSET